MSDSDSIDLAVDQNVFSENRTAYQNIQFLGAGGNAETYLMAAMSGPYQGVLFAVKFFRRLSKPEWKEGFFREVDFLQTCNHPAVMRYFDRGVFDRAAMSVGAETSDQFPFFVAEYLPDTLRTVIRSGRTPVVLKVSFAAQLLSALDYLSSRPTPVVHRDIKPDNIFVKGQSAVLGDFGLIKFQADGGDLEFLKSSIGYGMPRSYRTPDLVAYLSNLGPPPTPKSDVFQLGLVLAELFTGRNPQRALRDGERMTAPVELEDLRPIPGDRGAVVGDLIGRMLAVDPVVRPTAKDLLIEWQGLMFKLAELARALEGRVF